MVTPTDRPTDQPGEYRAICLFEIRQKKKGNDLQFKILTKASFRISINFKTSTKHLRLNAHQTPALKSCLNFNLKILTKPCTQSLNKCLAL